MLSRNFKRFSHYPVMHREVIELMEKHFDKDPRLVADLTLGPGGHTKRILDRFPSTRVVGTDIDPQMIQLAQNNLADYTDRVRIINRSYTEFARINLNSCFEDLRSTSKFDFILLDLGFNSIQVEDSSRGFTFRDPNAPLDMRFNPSDNSTQTAADWLNDTSPLEMQEQFRLYAGEVHFETLTEKIIKFRESKKFKVAGELNEVIASSFNKKRSETANQTRSRIYGAIRMAVNRELINVQEFLSVFLKKIDSRGVLAVITFNKSEDDIVSHMFNTCRKRGFAKAGKAIRPSKEELDENSRSKPAILRYLSLKI